MVIRSRVKPVWSWRLAYRPLLMLVVFGFAITRFFTWPDVMHASTFKSRATRIVSKAIDGDTLELQDGTRVRLIGVDTPEFGDGRPEAQAVEARTFTRKMVVGRQVHLQFDRERFDKYHRVLAFVHIDGKCLNEELAKAGLGRVMTRFRYSSLMRKRLLAAETEAKGKRVGIWHH